MNEGFDLSYEEQDFIEAVIFGNLSLERRVVDVDSLILKGLISFHYPGFIYTGGPTSEFFLYCQNKGIQDGLEKFN